MDARNQISAITYLPRPPPPRDTYVPATSPLKTLLFGELPMVAARSWMGPTTCGTRNGLAYGSWQVVGRPTLLVHMISNLGTYMAASQRRL